MSSSDAPLKQRAITEFLLAEEKVIPVESPNLERIQVQSPATISRVRKESIRVDNAVLVTNNATQFKAAFSVILQHNMAILNNAGKLTL